MPYYNNLTRTRMADVNLGLRVDRASATHAATTTAYFTVSGVIYLTGLVGTVVTASGANACRWTAVPTSGTQTYLCASTDIDAALAGDLLSITGVVATGIGYGGGITGMMQPHYVTTGSISFIAAAADGATSWSLFYVPVSDGAYVVST